MKGMRVARIAASMVTLMIAGASPHAAAPQQSASAETSRQGPTPSEIAQVRAALAEYRKLWATEFDAESRAIARQYGAPTPDDLDRMFRDWLAGGIALMPELPAGVPGKLADSFKMMPNKTPANPNPKPGEELPDFAKGAEPETLRTLKDANTNLDETRDKHAETASCSPEALSAKQALQTKLNAYRKALSDMEAARADVEREKGAGAALERAAWWGGAAGVVKSTADAAMDLFGAAGGVLPDTAALKPLKAGIEVVGSMYSMINGGLATVTAENTLSGTASATGATVGWVRAGGVLQGPQTTGGRSALNAGLAAGDLVTRALDTAVLNSETSPEGATSRNVETVGNVLQMSGSVKTALGELPGAAASVGQTGAVFSAAGTVVSTSAKYDRELGKAFDTILAGRDERPHYDTLNQTTLRQIDAKRIEFMEKIAALEAEISRSSCVK